jgi:hypothetical protein
MNQLVCSRVSGRAESITETSQFDAEGPSRPPETESPQRARVQGHASHYTSLPPRQRCGRRPAPLQSRVHHWRPEHFNSHALSGRESNLVAPRLDCHLHGLVQSVRNPKDKCRRLISAVHAWIVVDGSEIALASRVLWVRCCIQNRLVADDMQADLTARGVDAFALTATTNRPGNT